MTSDTNQTTKPEPAMGKKLNRLYPKDLLTLYFHLMEQNQSQSRRFRQVCRLLGPRTPEL